jgi:tyrosinase
MIRRFDRRRFLQSAAAGTLGAIIPFPEWFGRYGIADAQPPFVRYEVTTNQGAAMLGNYRTAVAAMVARPPQDACSWVFQWYTHEVRPDIGKAAAVLSLPAANRALPNEVWSTCQAHFGRGPTLFLPWHRMYLYFFERIVRAACGNPYFTLPYWNYVPKAARVMPADFRMSTSDPLYRPDRQSTVNGGQPIDGGNPFTIVSECMKETDYLPSLGHDGFNGAINGNPHGAVHTAIGTALGMGSVPWAANDPIFWLHHCNIDRMWASWNAWGYSNPPGPDWLNKEFVFADEHCNRVQVKVADFVATDPLGYRYDSLMPKISAGLIERLRRLRLIAHWPPPIPGPNPAVREQGPIQLGPRPVTVPLAPMAANRSFLARSIGGASQVRLSIADIATNVSPAIFYDVYLGTPAPAGRRATRIQIGTINFFGAERSPEHRHAEETGPSFTFDVTRAIRKLGRSGALEVTIAPHGKPAEGAVPVVGQVQLFAG